MPTIAHSAARTLPNSVVSRLRPIWHRTQRKWKYFRRGGRLRWSNASLCFVASKPMPGTGGGQRLEVCVRSPRELRRWMSYGEAGTDKVYDWLNALPRGAVLWDIGASNGLEGFQAALLRDCSVVFVEPFTPSIETILKTKYVNESRLGRKLPVEVVQAACSDSDSISRLVTHGRPVAGETANSMADNLDEYCAGGRGGREDESAQWLSFTTLDTLLERGLPAPTHLKVDVDGLEWRVLKGAQTLLQSPELQSIALEVNDGNRQRVDDLMAGCGFNRYDKYVHIDAGDRYTADHFYSCTPADGGGRPATPK